MPDEPNKKMDEMLRAYAEERRKAPDLPLHPATRNLLQGEVKRVFGNGPEPRPWWKRLRAFWPQLAFGGGLCVVLGIAVLSLRQPPRTEQKSVVETPVNLSSDAAAIPDVKKAKETEALLRQEVQSAAPEADLAAPNVGAPPENRGLEPARPSESGERLRRSTRPTAKMPAESRAESVLQRDDSSRTAGREATLADATSTSELQTLSKEKAEAPQLKTKVGARYISAEPVSPPSASDASKNIEAKAPVSTPALPAPTKLARTVELTNLGAARRLNFVQVTDTNLRLGATVGGVTPVLSSFQVEQFGTNVRFVDRDGSVYVGLLEPTNASAAFALKDDSPQTANSANFFFRAQGTNRTLGTDLLFTGHYFEQTNLVPSSIDTFAIAPGARPKPTNQARHLIIGNATVGATNNVPVRAVSTGP